MNRSTSPLLISLLPVILLLSSALAGEPGSYMLEGKGYFSYLHDFSDDNGQTNKFDFERMYFGTKYYLSDEFTIRYLTDISHQPGDGKLEVFTKYAYLDWKMTDNLNLVMGLQGTNNWSMPERAWGYRSIKYSPMENFGKFWGKWTSLYTKHLDDWAQADPAKSDELRYQKSNFNSAIRSGMGSSADLGVGVKYKPMDNSYVNFMVRNGLGYKKTEDDMFKNFQVRTGTYLMDNLLHLSAYIELEPWRGVDSDGSAMGYMNLQWDVMAAFEIKSSFTAGVDVNAKTFPGNFEDITAMCFSVFGHGYLLPKKLKALARYDIYNTGFNEIKLPAGASKYKFNGSLFIVGLDYKPHKNVSIIPNVQIITYEDSDKKSDNSMFVHIYFNL